ncbi:MAG: hypothetical protein K5876_06925 [Ruminiclostridium sp.]|nr:hypothetical protein [Ruminiclostridium sp.]
MNNMFKRVASGFVTNLKTIIQSLVFSVIIWVFISIQIFPDISMHIKDIPVSCEPTALMTEENLKIVSIDTNEVTVQIEGKRYAMSSLTADDFTATCDLSEIYNSGEYTVPINVNLTDTNAECRIATNNLTAVVRVVKIVTREVSVMPNTNSLRIADEMQIEGEVTVSPSVVEITGEESLVNSVDHIQALATYDEGDLDHSAAITASPLFFNKNGIKLVSPKISCNVSEFIVNVPVYKVKTLPVQVKFTGSKASTGFSVDELEYKMSIDEITIASPDSSIDNLDAIDIGEISLSSLTLKDLQGGVVLPVDLPEGYKNISGNKSITVTFPGADNFGQLGFMVPSENFTIINKPSNYDVKVLTNELTVNVVGYSNYIQEMTSSDIYATINLLGIELTQGTKSVSVTFRLSGASVKAWVAGEEYKVELLITEAEEDVEETESV